MSLMRIAIHNRLTGFHLRFKEYCERHGIPYKLVDCYRSDIVEQLADCDALMWVHHQGTPQDLLFAKQLLFALQQAGMPVFPDFNTGWHFDDKIAQKYLMEAMGIASPDTYVSYDKKEALRWIETAEFPLVFKLRSGAGAQNVELVPTRRKAAKLIRKAFGRGFSKFNRTAYMKDRVKKSLSGQDRPVGALKGIARLFIPTSLEKKSVREKGYVFFQQFLPGNEFDIRVMVVGGRAIANKRLVRKGDFRASGSGRIVYDRNEIDIECIKLAFDVAGKLEAQSIAFDFVYKYGKPVVIEFSYAFSTGRERPEPGYWDRSLVWHEGPVDPYGWMVEGVLAKITK